ncbi:hypothetical protein DBT_0543 [Dissulfuribacter thermophilus]|uniref:Uncharacterized protein n=1 Tax=Dissulfuribacter thermophilus TaxID=1156395 RepID=A0A1B9F8H5_9BACT|nr:hypothetical protein DBT_0543 [Dissulfuribacter thermophilus]
MAIIISIPNCGNANLILDSNYDAAGKFYKILFEGYTGEVFNRI